MLLTRREKHFDSKVHHIYMKGRIAFSQSISDLHDRTYSMTTKGNKIEKSACEQTLHYVVHLKQNHKKIHEDDFEMCVQKPYAVVPMNHLKACVSSVQ